MIKEITNIDNQEFIEFSKIYLEAFPKNERHSIEKIKERIISTKEKLIVYFHEDKLIGIALIWDLNFNNLLVLDYFAIEKSNRNNGFGSKFISALIKYSKDQGNTLLIEIENPYLNINNTKTKRHNFYKSFGFIELKDYVYLLPSMNDHPPVEMLLMFSEWNENLFEKIEFQMELLIKLYTELYYLDKDSEFIRSRISELKQIKKQG